MKYVPKIILLLIIGVVVYLLFIRQGYAVHVYRREYLDSYFPVKGYSLRKSLKELLGYKTDLCSPYPERLEKLLATPLNRLGDVAGGGDGAVGGVGVSGADVAGGAEDFAHVFGEVEAVGVPGAVFLDSQRTGGDSLSGVPRN